MSLVIVWDGMQAMRPKGSRDTDPVQWVPIEDEAATFVAADDGTHVSRRTWAKGSARGAGGPVREGSVVTRTAKVEPCECGTMRPASVRYHAAMLRVVDDMKCPHGNVLWSACSGRVPPPCCWDVP